MKSPSIPAARPMPTASTTAPGGGGGGSGSAQAAAFRGFNFVPQLTALGQKRPGRKSLIGG